MLVTGPLSETPAAVKVPDAITVDAKLSVDTAVDCTSPLPETENDDADMVAAVSAPVVNAALETRPDDVTELDVSTPGSDKLGSARPPLTAIVAAVTEPADENDAAVMAFAADRLPVAIDEAALCSWTCRNGCHAAAKRHCIGPCSAFCQSACHVKQRSRSRSIWQL